MAKSHQSEGLLATAAGASPRPLAASRASMLDALYRDHMRDLIRYIGARFGAGPPEPEEVAQAAFARLASSETGDLNNPRGYLYTIACNIAIDQRRRAGHRNAVHHDIFVQTTEEELSGSSPERVLLAKERLALFEKVLAAMPKLRRRIFLLVRVEGCSPREVAHRFGMKEDAVHKHVSRALQDCAAAFDRAERQK